LIRQTRLATTSAAVSWAKATVIILGGGLRLVDEGCSIKLCCCKTASCHHAASSLDSRRSARPKAAAETSAPIYGCICATHAQQQ
jgi:hypothetical protein